MENVMIDINKSAINNLQAIFSELLKNPYVVIEVRNIMSINLKRFSTS